SELYKVGVKKDVNFIYTEESNGDYGLAHIYCMMAIFATSMAVDSVVTRRPIQKKSGRVHKQLPQGAKSEKKDEEPSKEVQPEN
ncbi:hypothetical protein EIN_253040, partial [Entamoeba invadens IP1]